MKYSQRSRDRNYIEASSFDVRTLNLPSSQIRHKTHLMETELENNLVSSEVFFGIPLFLLMLSEIRLAKGLGQQGDLQRDVGIPPQAVSQVALSLRGLAFFLRT